ncbi:hypothetical protein [Streptomyces sp. NPDC050264]|uniref:hypothetical protein n=1 Tax=Streptomyces sp. NPDC050264 TaxID=3155038 RepID=UPI00341A81F7
MLAREEVLDRLVLEQTAPGLLDGRLRQLTVVAQRRERRLLDDVVHLLLVERLEPGERRPRTRDQFVDLALGFHGRLPFPRPFR